MKEKWGDDAVVQHLVGHVVEGLLVLPGEQSIVWLLKGDLEARWIVDADCCSESWFAETIGIASIIGKAIESARALHMPEYYLAAAHAHASDGIGERRQEVTKYYGLELTAVDGGRCQIMYRNSSNGYYGGSLGGEDCGLVRPRHPTLEGELVTQYDWTAPGSG